MSYLWLKKVGVPLLLEAPEVWLSLLFENSHECKSWLNTSAFMARLLQPPFLNFLPTLGSCFEACFEYILYHYEITLSYLASKILTSSPRSLS